VVLGVCALIRGVNLEFWRVKCIVCMQCFYSERLHSGPNLVCLHDSKQWCFLDQSTYTSHVAFESLRCQICSLSATAMCHCQAADKHSAVMAVDEY
jgi:hypothetical protein